METWKQCTILFVSVQFFYNTLNYILKHIMALLLFYSCRFLFNNPEKSKLWMSAIRLKCANPSKYTKICSEHFLQTDFRIKNWKMLSSSFKI